MNYRTACFALLLAIFSVHHAVAQEKETTTARQKIEPLKWRELIESRDLDGAQKVCEEAIQAESVSVSRQIQANLCLGAVALNRGKSSVSMQKFGSGQGRIENQKSPQAAMQASKYFSKMIELSPQAWDFHATRTNAFFEALDFEQLVGAMEQSLAVYKGTKADENCIAYSSNLYERTLYDLAIRLLLACAKQNPNSHRVQGNLAGIYATQAKFNDAIPHGRNAVRLKSDDQINTWTLAYALMKAANRDEADEYFVKSLKIEKAKGKVSDDRVCLYSEFLTANKRDPTQFCELKLTECEGKKPICKALSAEMPESD